ncbi:MAG: trypsin-like peptidase domain-containing protein [Bacilli bacterium]|jgi:serine protease Do|nr:trypsin-like peptidase domain-containing protein [Bacilli bacterium]MDY0064036.1 trypsin-like peptidase domain-containing protein [Bacilli bacterium]
MKKIFAFILLIGSLIILGGCSNLVHNEIYNKSYQVEEITLTEFENLVEAVVEMVNPAVIGVAHYATAGLPGIYTLVGTGSGVIYKGFAILNDDTITPIEDTVDSEDVKTYEYYFVTNRHVVLNDDGEEADKLEVYFGPEDVDIVAELIEYDPQVDIAVGKFQFTKYIQPLEFSDSDLLKPGSFALAIGSPSGLEFYNSVTFGIISHPKRYISESDDTGKNVWDQEYIQHDVAINPGNSGGPLVNLEGKIIGINTMKFVSSDIDNMGFSIPSNLVSEVVTFLEEGIQPTRPRLGIESITIRELDDAGREEYDIPTDLTFGLKVMRVEPISLAKTADIRVNDIILEFNDVEMRYSYHIRTELGKFIIGSGETAEVKIYRAGEIIYKTIVF